MNQPNSLVLPDDKKVVTFRPLACKSTSSDTQLRLQIGSILPSNRLRTCGSAVRLFLAIYRLE